MKKSLAFILTVLMLFSALSVFASSAEEPCDCGHAPIVFIEGMNARDLILDQGTDRGAVAYPFSGDAVADLVKNNAGAIWDMLDARFGADTERKVADAVKSLFADAAMNDDGTSLYDIAVDWTPPEDPAHSEGQYFKYCFDWRLDPFTNAAGLKDFIAYVKELTGHDTVHIIGFSQGATVLNTYLHEYGCDGLETVIWYCGAHNGTALVGSLFSGRLRMDAASITGFVNNATDNNFLYNTLSAVLQGLTDIGITGGVLDLVNVGLKQFMEDGVMREIFLDTFGRMPGMWSLVPPEDYDAAKRFLFGEGEQAAPYAALIETIDRYHDEVQVNSAAIMEEARQQVGKIAVIAKYNVRMAPFMEADNRQADSMIDTVHASCGATVADFGQTLGDGYAQKIDDGHNHLSADGIIDASTALFPDYTWFIKNAEHSRGIAYNDALLRHICESDRQPDVFEDDAYPQFAYYSPATGQTFPLTEDTDERPDTKLILRIKAFLQKLAAFWRQLSEKVC